MYSKTVTDKFSNFVERYKVKYKHASYIDALVEVIEANHFDFVTLTNARLFLSKSLKEKLKTEYAARSLIKPEHIKKRRYLF